MASKTPRRRYIIGLNKNTDVDIIKKLEVVRNKAGYIKELIRRDLEKSKIEI